MTFSTSASSAARSSPCFIFANTPETPRRRPSGPALISSGHKEVPVTHLRTMMLEELQRRNYSQTTVKAYLKIVESFAKHFHRPPDQLGPDQIRSYQVYLLNERKLGVRTVGHHTAALRFF